MLTTMVEKRNFQERLTTMVNDDILLKEVRNDICRICLTACSCELALLEEK